MANRKTHAGTTSATINATTQPGAQPAPNAEPSAALFCATHEEQIRHMYGSMTPQDALELLHELGILTPTGKLSFKYT